MPGSRKPGPQCSHNDLIDLDDGTKCLTRSPVPGPLGTTSHVLTDVEDGQSVNSAFTRAAELAPGALNQEIGLAFGEALAGIIPGLIKVLKHQANSTAKGSMLSAGTNPLPRAAADGHRDILTSLGLEFLPESIDGSLAEMTRCLQAGVS